jgi:2-keto-3-deoxy-L-rhamnonate aldolase
MFIESHHTETFNTSQMPAEMANTASQTAPPPGVFVPVPTFFRSAADSNDAVEPEVDIETQVAHSVFLAKSGITGLTILGSTGEAIHLSRNERRDLVAGVRAGLQHAGFENYPIMAGVLANSIGETLEWLQDYAAAGAQWGLVLAPGYFGKAVNQRNLIDWFTAVADRSPLPILM